MCAVYERRTMREGGNARTRRVAQTEVVSFAGDVGRRMCKAQSVMTDAQAFR
jgi:hypothetical protein